MTKIVLVVVILWLAWVTDCIVRFDDFNREQVVAHKHKIVFVD